MLWGLSLLDPTSLCYKFENFWVASGFNELVIFAEIFTAIKGLVKNHLEKLEIYNLVKRIWELVKQGTEEYISYSEFQYALIHEETIVAIMHTCFCQAEERDKDLLKGIKPEDHAAKKEKGEESADDEVNVRAPQDPAKVQATYIDQINRYKEYADLRKRRVEKQAMLRLEQLEFEKAAAGGPCDDVVQSDSHHHRGAAKAMYSPALAAQYLETTSLHNS